MQHVNHQISLTRKTIFGMQKWVKVVLAAMLMAGAAFNLTPPRLVQAATFLVNTTADTSDASVGNGTCADSSGFCSLRAAIQEANASASNIITLPAGTYVLNSQLVFGTSDNHTVTINGAGSATTIIQMTSSTTTRDRILLINDNAFRNNINVSIENVTFRNGYLSTDTYGGGAILAGGPSNNTLTLNNVVFENNITPATTIGGGALMFNPGGTLNVNGCTFTNNQSLNPGESGGGVLLYFIDGYSGSFNISNSTFNGNTSAGTIANADGGGAIGMILDGGTFTGTIEKNTFINNSATSGYGGALNFRSLVSTSSPINVQYNRFYGNTASQGSGLSYIDGYANVTANNNWWGCNTGPSASPCNVAGTYVEAGRSGALTASNWITLHTTASPTSGAAGSNVTLTASFLQNSAGTTLTAANVSALQGVTVNWQTPTNGSITGSPETTIQSDGQADATLHLTSTCPTTATETATVDGVPNGDSTATASVSVLCANDLTGAAFNDVSSSTEFPTGWNWTVSIGNDDTESLTIPIGTVVLRDQLPTSGLSYGTPDVPADTDLTGTVTCGIASSVLTCTATTALTLAGSGSFDVNFAVTPSTYGEFTNPRTSGTCSVDPDNAITESDETNNACSDAVTVNAAPDITSGDNTTFTVGTPGTFTVTTTGYPSGSSMSITSSDTPPSGLSFVDNHNGTATLSGTPAAGTGGVYYFTISADNGIGSADTQSFTLTINQAPAFTSGTSTDFIRGESGTFTVTATGYPIPSISLAGGTMPAGVDLTDNGDGTATLSGTPTGTAGSYPLFLSASNGVGSDASQTFNLNITEAPLFTSSDTTTFIVGSPASFTIQTTGYPAAGISTTDTLPSGVTLTNNGDGTATLAGTPASGTDGTHTITLNAANGVTPDDTQTFTLEILPEFAITSADNETFGIGFLQSFTVTTNRSSDVTLEISSGSLPSDLSFTDNGDGTASISGTPGVGSGDLYTFTILAHHFSETDSQTFYLTINEPAGITSSDNTDFYESTPGSFTVTTSGYPTGSSMAIGTVSSLPSGVTLTNNNDGTATLAGTPLAGTAGAYAVSITADNGIGSPDAQDFTLTVNLQPSFTSADTTSFELGAYSTFSITTAGYPDPLISITSGSLPAGISLVDQLDGSAILSGTPTGTIGAYTFTLTASNGVGSNATQPFTLNITQAPAFTSGSSTTFTAGSSGSFTVQTSGFPAATISLTGSLPSGVSFTDNGDGTATISGTPTAGTGAVYTFTLDATNGVSPDASQTFTLTVNEAPSFTSSNNTTFSTGASGNFTVTTGGYPAPAISITSGSLPSGVTLYDNGDGTASISGTPSGTLGNYVVTLTANNGVGSAATQTFTLTVNESPAFTSADAETFTELAAGSFTIQTTGNPTPSISTSSTLPSGVSLIDNSNGTATLSGTPAYASGGEYILNLVANNGVIPNGTQTFTLTVIAAPSFTSADNTSLTVGSAASFSITTNGYPDPSITLSTGTLPAGVTFTDNGDGTGTFGGNPSTGAGGVYTLELTAHNSSGSDAVQTFTMTVNETPSFTSGTSATFVEGESNTFTVTTYGYPINSLSPSGTFPAGVTFVNNGNNTATLSGTPSSGSSGTYNLTFIAFNGGTTIYQDFTLTVTTLPTVTLINSVANTGDGEVVEDEYTNAGITQLSVTFSKDMDATDVINTENYQLMDQGLLVPITINSVTYNGTTHVATLNINGGTALADGTYLLTVSQYIPDTDGFTMEADFTRTFHVDATGPAVLSNTVVGMPGNQSITTGGAFTGSYTYFTVNFSSDVSTAGGASGVDSATNPSNYLLLQPGLDTTFDTSGCDAFAANGNAPLDDDILIPTGPVVYSNGGGSGPYTATVTVNGGTALPVGSYRLLICGTTSIVDLVGNPLNSGTDTVINFRIYTPTAPSTGFAPGVITQLGIQPADVVYSDQDDLTIEIPALGVNSAIVGIPVDNTSWNIAWLYDQVGWLEGTAYPTWNGNSVLTAHAYTADGLPGPFANLRSLGYGSQIMIHLDGMVYTYVVQSNTLVSPQATSYLTRSDTYSWLTLVTCQNYDEQTDTYRFRRVVRAVLISVSSEN